MMLFTSFWTLALQLFVQNKDMPVKDNTTFVSEKQ